jgi:hypothetical protein
MKFSKRSLIIALIGIVFVLYNSNISYTRVPEKNIERVIDSDGLGYYVYLPSLFLKHDVLHQWYALHLQNGYSLNKYTCGVAMLETPFYLIGNELTRIFGTEVKEGRGPWYVRMITVSTSFYLFISLLVLFNIIRRKFNVKTALFTVLTLYYATNMYYYAVVEPGMSHIYSLFCFTLCLYAADNYYTSFRRRDVFMFAFFFGLATLIRPTNILMGFLFLFYDVYTWEQLKARVLFHRKHLSNFLIIAVLGLIIALPQMLYWHAITGHYVVFSYGYNHESFSNWKSPYILSVLGSYKSGWLFYSPVMVLSLIGIFICIRKKVMSAPVILLIFALILYICASWWAPTFGCAFGYRSFVEYYAILALPFAAVVYSIFMKGKKWGMALLMVLSVCCIYINLKATKTYVRSGGCWDGPDFHWSDMVERIEKAERESIFVTD